MTADPHAEWAPCPPDQECANCRCTMTRHWTKNPRCECGCLSWRCKHGGFEWIPPQRAVYA